MGIFILMFHSTLLHISCLIPKNLEMNILFKLRYQTGSLEINNYSQKFSSIVKQIMD